MTAADLSHTFPAGVCTESLGRRGMDMVWSNRRVLASSVNYSPTMEAGR